MKNGSGGGGEDGGGEDGGGGGYRIATVLHMIQILCGMTCKYN
jgi:hypothetical protein